ncbi:MAG: sulfoxide reductase heme-binding subunit YedZ [Gammaproteobacteria bacterium]|nr:sulfoxide reductase heme-binding subunit YedZ [Gammaproteobacteria bacterium]
MSQGHAHRAKPDLRWAAAKVLLFVVLALPLGLLAYDLYREIVTPGSVFGPDPESEVVRYLGEWAIRMLMATLAVSPASRLFKRPHWVRFRRMFGLFAFAYVVMHFVGYWGLFWQFDPSAFVNDFVGKRPYITVGMAALVCLIPLAATSTRGWQRRLRRTWRRLHRLVYVIGVLACIHLWWLSKGGYGEAVAYSAILALLLGERVVHRVRIQRSAR